MDTEKVLEVIHEVGILSCMLLFIYTGGALMTTGGDTNILPLVAGFLLMLVGATVIVRSPSRWREKQALYYATHRDYVTEEVAKA